MAKWGLVFCWVASLLLACEAPPATRSREARPVELVLIHTADLHSHLFPEAQRIGSADAARGLGPAGEVATVGGFARIASIVNDIRANADHSLYLDSGDLIEGTAAFTEFHGEPELRAYSALQLGAAALGNHDLDPGAEAFAELHRRFAGFPTLAANFADNGSELVSEIDQSVVLDAKGLKVGVIGVANPSSPRGLDRHANAYGVELLPLARAVQQQIDRLLVKVDLVVLVSHLGLQGDEALIRATSGLDVVLGGHQHLSLDSALERFDCGPAVQAERSCKPRRVILVHSGALGRYVGELDLVLAPASDGVGSSKASELGLEVASARHSLLPVSERVADDPALAALLEPYRRALDTAGYDTPVAFALDEVERYAASGGDSALGNLITEAIRSRTHADFVILNATGIRASLAPGTLTRAEFSAVLPFGDGLTQLSIAAAELQRLLSDQARLASERECQSPIQVAGLEVRFKCSGANSSAVLALAGTHQGLASNKRYTLVTSTYLADGGSGFDALSGLRERERLEADPLEILLSAVAQLRPCARSSLPCIDPAALRDGRIRIERP